MKTYAINSWISTTPSVPWRKMTGPAPVTRAEPNLVLGGETGRPWEGFGGCFNELGWGALQSLEPQRREAVLAELFHPFRGCRFNLCRLPIGASDYALSWYSLNENPNDFRMRRFSIERDRRGLIPYIRSALRFQPAMKLFASPWSPPTWLKDPPVYNSGKLIWKKKYLDAYALYFLKFIRAYAAAGITIHQIHVQNEPVADQKFPSCLWTGAELRDFIRDHLGPLFRREKVSCEIWLGTLNTADYNGFPNTVLMDPAARDFVSGVGFQWAGKFAVQRTHRAWPGVRLMQTENECGNGTNTWVYAQFIYDLIHHYISSGVEAYVYWNMILPAGGSSTWGWKQNSMITVDEKARRVTFNPEFHVMKHFSRFIERGAVRLGLEGPWSGNAVAFRNPDGSRILVLNNPFENQKTVFLDIGEAVLPLAVKPHSYHSLRLV